MSFPTLFVLGGATFCVRVTMALAHFLWQGLVVGLFVGWMMWVLRRASARMRYWLLAGSLGIMAACPVLTFLVLPSTGPEKMAASAAAHRSGLDPEPSAGRFDLGQGSRPLGDFEQAAARRVDETPTPTGVVAPGPSHWQRFAPWAVTFYLAGVALFLLRLGVALHGGRRLCRQSEPVCEPAVLAAVARQATALGMRLAPAVAFCRQVAVPTVVGVFRPMILFPFALSGGLALGELEAILTHELAHIRRYDHVVNLIQRLVEAALFFHPAVWIVSRLMRIEREHCCDDLVVALGSQPLSYAGSLLHIAELSTSLGASMGLANATALHAAGRPSQLRQRIARLLRNPSEPQVRMGAGWALTILAALAISLATTVWFQLQAAPPARAGQTLALPASQLAPASDDLGPETAKQSGEKTAGAWGQERDGLRTQLVLLTDKPAVGQPLMFRLEMKNFGAVVRQYDPQEAEPFRTVSVKRENGQADPYVGISYQTAGGPVPIQPGETVVLWDRYDVAANSLLAEPGKYVVQFTGTKTHTMPPLPGGARQPAESGIPPSMAVTVDLAPGKLPEPKATFVRLRGIAPQGWQASLNGNAVFFTHSPTGLKKDVTTVQVWFDAKEHPPGYALGQGANKIPVVQLGKTQIGFAYLTAPPQAARLWPDFRAQIVGRLEMLGDAQDTIVGTLLWRGQPLRGCRVRAFEGSVLLDERFTTDEQGQFRVPKAWRQADHFLSVVAFNNNCIGWFDFYVHARADQGGQNPMDGSFTITFVSLSHRVRGRLVDERDRPLAGIPVRIDTLSHAANLLSTHWGEREVNGRRIVPEAVTDRDGFFELHVPVDTSATARVVHPDWASQRFPVGKDVMDLGVKRLMAAAKVSGRATSAQDGSPIAGARIAAQAIDPLTGGAWGTALTDREGRYTIGGLGAGTFNVFFDDESNPSLTAVAHAGLVLTSGQTELADFSVGTGRRLTGRVVDQATGEPLANCTVSCYGPARPSTGGASLSTQTNDRGEFAFFVPPGASRVYVSDERETGNESARDVEVSADRDPAPVQLKAGSKTDASRIRILLGKPADR